MKTIKINETNFDSIKVMRQIRDDISKEIMNMSYDEEKEYLDELLAKNRASKTASDDTKLP